MNLLKIQDALKNASDDQLMQLMQAPDSSAPSYLVLSEIRRRKDMRAQQPQEPQGTVAEDLASTPQTYDQAGIRSLRTPGYEEEERVPSEDVEEMREGGVVRMDNGGQIFGEGGPLLTEDDYRRLRPDLFVTSSPPPVVAPVEGQGNQTEGEIPIPPPYLPPPTTQAATPGQQRQTRPTAATTAGMPEQSILDYMRNYQQAFPSGLEGLRESLQRNRVNPEQRRREAQNLALVEAGLRMASSKNPSFLGSIGEGATPAVQSYAQQLGQIRQDERQDIRDRFSLEQANLQRMYALGQISAAEFRTRSAEAGASARAAAANETQRLIGERQATALESRERTAAATAEATAQRAMDAQLAQALRNPDLRQQTRMSLQAERSAQGNRTPVTEADISNAIVQLGIRPGVSSPQPQGSIVVTDGVQRYVR
jgi:hypothetical protein